MQIKKLKVRPQKSTHALPALSPLDTLAFSLCHHRFLFIHSLFRFFNCYIDPPVVLCGPQLASMLGCWAATKDVKSIGPCREHAEALFECMRTAVRSPSAFSFVSQHRTDKSYSCATAHEAQTTQTVYQLSFGTIREDSKGLATSHALVT